MNSRSRGPLAGLGLVFLIGLVLIAAGIVCLVLSDNGPTGWGQATLDAFGVALIVGGSVDVLAISWLNKEQQKHNELAEFPGPSRRP